MERSLLETEVMDSLENYGLIEKSKPNVFYKPENMGEGYRRLRSWAFRNSGTLAWTGIGIVGAGIGTTAYFSPSIATKLAAGIGAAGFLGAGLRVAGFFDRFFSYNPKDVASRVFTRVNVPWNEAYDLVRFGSRKELDGYVLMAQTPEAIRDAFSHHEYQLTLGVSIAATADNLSRIKADGSLPGLYLDGLVDMMSRQKIGTSSETEAVKELRNRNSPSRLAKVLKNLDYYDQKTIEGSKRARKKAARTREKFPDIDVLKRHVSSYEFALMISGADNVESIGSQISCGCLYIENSTGPNTGSYAGRFSKDREFPRIFVKDDSGQSFMTHATRGFGYVGGNAQQKVLEKAKGGVVIVEGIAEHRFGAGIDDEKDWPGIAISLGGVTKLPERGYARNGMIATLDQSDTLHRKAPAVYTFRNGDMEVVEFAAKGENRMNELVVLVDKYIREWVERRDRK